jgi:hypothetical protein
MVRIFGGEARGAKYNAGGSLLLHEYGFRRHRRLGAHRGRCGHRDELGQRAHRDAQRGPKMSGSITLLFLCFFAGSGNCPCRSQPARPRFMARAAA